MAQSSAEARQTLSFALLSGVLVLLIGSGAAPGQVGDHRGDLWHYFQVSGYLLRGELPFRDFPLEYPPLALLPFLLPRLALLGHSTSYAQYVWAFLVQSALLTTLLVLTLRDMASRFPMPPPPKMAGLLFLLLLVAASPTLPWRYDLFPALLTALALRAVLDNHPKQAGLWLGLGTAAKLYPLVLLPVFAIYLFVGRERRAAAHLVTTTLLTTFACLLPSLCLSPHTALSFLHYHQLRGLEVESSGAGLLLLAHAVCGIPLSVVYNYGADHLVSPNSAAVLACLPVLFGLGLVGLLWKFGQECRRKPEPETLLRTTVAVLLAGLLLNKVFSPQYLIWLLPFAPLLRLREALALLLVFALTAILSLTAFPGLLTLQIGAILLLNLRNLIIVVILGGLALQSRLFQPQTLSLLGDIPCVSN